MNDLRDRVPGHGLVERLVVEWQQGHIVHDGRRAFVDDNARGWYRGVLGERAVAEQLDGLGPGWLVLHSVPVGRHDTDIDHVVIGPPGVFTINTKFSPGKNVWAKGYGLYVDGAKTSYVPKALAEARRASARLSRACDLSVPVSALIVFVDPGRLSLGDHIGGAEGDPPLQVTSARRLAEHLRGPERLNPEQIERICRAAVRPDTWHDRPPASSDLALAREFDALEAAVGPALASPTRTARSRPPGGPRAARSAPSRRPSSRRGGSRPGPIESLVRGVLSLAVTIGFSYWFFTSLMPSILAGL